METRHPIALGPPVTPFVVTSPFGPRTLDGETHLHAGLDLRATTGQPVYAAADGVVVRSYKGERGYNQRTGALLWRSYGECVVVDHGGGYRTRYAHLHVRHAQKGERVRKGDIIGLAGSTGDSKAPHLHFELTYAPPGQQEAHLDPLPYLERS